MNMEEFQGERRGMLTTEEWCNPVSNMLHHMKEGLSEDWAREGSLDKIRVMHILVKTLFILLNRVKFLIFYLE